MKLETQTIINILYLVAMLAGLGIVAVLVASFSDEVLKLRSKLKNDLSKIVSNLDMDDPFIALFFESFKKFARNVKNQVDSQDDVFIIFIMKLMDSVFGKQKGYQDNRENIQNKIIDFLVFVVDSVYNEVDEIK